MTTRIVKIVALVLGLIINDVALGFHLQGLSSKHHSGTALFQHNDGAGGSGNLEMDRRVAMATAAALASTLQQQPEPANALGVGPLEFICFNLLMENKATVNTNGDPVKHTPIISLEPDPKTKGYGRILTMSVPHVMDPEKPHFIQYMWLYDVTRGRNGAGNVISAKEFTANDASPPSIVATVASGRSATKYAQITKGTVLKPYIYCNLHGLWEGEAVAL